VKKNNLHAIFQISPDTVLTVTLLDTKYKELTRHSDRKQGDEELFSNLNHLREIYWLDLEHKDELLRIYQNYHTEYRPLYTVIETGLELLKDVYEGVKKIKQDLLVLLEKEEVIGKNHLLLQEVHLFLTCVEILLRFYDPSCSLLSQDNVPRSYDEVDKFLGFLLAVMIEAPQKMDVLLEKLDLPPPMKLRLKDLLSFMVKE